jgi:hypothetical protein
VSNAMVLCASLEPTVELVDVPPGVPVGSRVVVRWDAGVALPPPELEVNPSRKNNPWSTCQPHLMVDEQGLLVLKDARGPGLHEPLFARWGLGEGVRVCVEVGWEVPSTCPVRMCDCVAPWLLAAGFRMDRAGNPRPCLQPR